MAGRSLPSHCPECAASLSDPSAVRDDVFDPDEADSLDARDFIGSDPVVLARFGNIAEAGYFADELSNGFDIPCRLDVVEDFDALSGFWSSEIRLSVPGALREEAFEAFAELVADEYGSDPEFDVSTFSSPHSSLTEPYSEQAAPHLITDDPRFEQLREANWNRRGSSPLLPILLSFTAGCTMGFWIINASRPLAANREGGPEAVLSELSEQGGPWIQTLPEGKRLLEFDRELGTARILDDQDGDGRFDRETLYRVR